MLPATGWVTCRQGQKTVGCHGYPTANGLPPTGHVSFLEA
jgi:hypothetical protein